jgi:hypothetical protein
LDYKTGKQQKTNNWLGERIKEPQLPIYALAADVGEGDAVAFATVRTGNDMGFEGLSSEDIDIKGITPCNAKKKDQDDWHAVRKHWQEHIDMLAEEFVQGRSDVSPAHTDACKYCQMEAICRIDELQQGEDAL